MLGSKGWELGTGGGGDCSCTSALEGPLGCSPPPSPTPSQGTRLPGSQSWDLDLGMGLPGTDGPQLDRQARWARGSILEPLCFVPLQGLVEPQGPPPRAEQAREEARPSVGAS